MLDQHHRAECVGLKGSERVVVVYLTRRLLGVQDAWNSQSEVEVGLLLRKGGGECRCCIGDSLFICDTCEKKLVWIGRLLCSVADSEASLVMSLGRTAPLPDITRPT